MASPQPNIEHPGIIQTLTGTKATVSILSQSACSSCHSKSYCSMSEMAEKIVEVDLPPGSSFQIGQQVTITLRQNLGYKALFLGYLLPFLILLLSLIILLQLTQNELLSGLLSVALMFPYYGILYLRREQVKQQFRFFIKH